MSVKRIDSPESSTTPTTRLLTGKHRKTSDAIDEEMLYLLSCFEPMSDADLVDELRLSKMAVFRRTKRMWGQMTIHVAAWRNNSSGPPTPFYAIGPASDAPVGKLNDNKRQRYMAKLRMDSKRLAEYKAKRRRRFKERMKDPDFAEAQRKKDRERKRAAHGHKPRVPKPKDHLLNALMGKRRTA